MKIGQDQHYQGEDWWDWSVWIDATPAELDGVEKVIWHLHPTFPQSVVELTNRLENFRLRTAGWGAFKVRAAVVMKDGATTMLYHDLDLRYPDGRLTQA